jgi:hypothetical protein
MLLDHDEDSSALLQIKKRLSSHPHSCNTTVRIALTVLQMRNSEPNDSIFSVQTGFLIPNTLHWSSI